MWYDGVVDTFCISSAILGSEKHIIVSGDGFFTTSKDPKEVWFLDGTLDPNKPLCLDSILRLNGTDISIKPPDRWHKPMTLLTSGSLDVRIPWSQVMPSLPYKHFVKTLIKSIVDVIQSLPKDYYISSWGPGGRFLSSLKAAKVDANLFKEACDSVDRDSGALETFKPGPGGYLPVVEYDRFATRTGRLKVSSGPNILTLKKEHRKLLKSNFPGGYICSIDFSALEARIILAETGKEFDGPDLYAKIARELFGGTIDRDVVKGAVISELYGSSKHTLGLRLGISGSKLDEFVGTIREYFETQHLKKRLKEEYSLTSKIKNKYGRPLELPEPQDHLLVNTFAQSTGVDVSLLGFKNVVEQLGTDGIRPLFVLHDALILDVREDRIKDVEGIKSTIVPGYSSKFPLKFETI